MRQAAEYRSICGCNEPLHYKEELIRDFVVSVIDDKGPMQPVTVFGLGTFLVPRHYIACHGPTKGYQWPDLAREFDWPQS